MYQKLIGIAVALVVLSVIFAVLERFWPGKRGQRRRRRGWRTDLAWFAWDPIVNKPLGLVAVVVGLVFIAVLFRVPPDGESLRAFANRETPISAQPAWVQALELLVLLDLTGYWSHRAFHRLGLLWRYHTIHHSSQELDWLSSVRVHPLNEAGQRLAQSIPFLLLGFKAGILAAYVPLFTLYAVMLHGNLHWSYGRLRYVVASPVFHRWHHTTEREGLDRNFAGLFPWVDLLFGTLYMPKDRLPEEFGILGERVPESFLAQLLYPFRRRRPPAVATEPSANAGEGLASP